MSLFKKLAASANVSVAPSPKPSSTVAPAPATGAKWTAVLQRHDGGPHHVLVMGACPLTPDQLNKGCVCLASTPVATATRAPFLVYLTADCVCEGTSTFSISLSNKMCDLFQISRDVKEIFLDDLTTEIGPKDQNFNITSNALTDLVISIKDRYVSKRELWMFQIRLLGSVVYKSLSVPYESMLRCSSAIVEDVSPSVIAGIVGPQTKIVVRSSSAQICLMVDISRELWDFDPVTCQPLFKKSTQLLVNGLGQCVAEGKHHYLILLVSARFDEEDMFELVYDGPIVNLDVGRIEENFSQFFNNFPSRIGWIDNPFYTNSAEGGGPDWFTPKSPSGTTSVVRDSALCGCSHDDSLNPTRVPSSCVETNLLESINLAISHFSKHHMDRKLNVTGTQITIVSANKGLLKVADPKLFEVSRRRVQATACGIRVVSVGSPPTIPTYRPVCLVGTPATRHTMDWLVFYYFQGDSPVIGSGFEPIDLVASILLPTELQRQSAMFDFSRVEQFKSPVLSSDLSSVARKKSVPTPFTSTVAKKPPRTDPEILQLSLAMPRLQRVAVEAAIRPGDVKPIDNWIVQGEGVKTLHDLIGTRLSLDMQLVDISGTEPGGIPSPPAAVIQQSVSSGGALSPKSDRAPSSSIISANAFGVKVHRASMRETHIQKVLLRGGEDRCMWMLNRLDSGNVYVSRVALTGSNNVSAVGSASNHLDEASLVYWYKYVLRRPLSTVAAPLSDVIACKSCLEIGEWSSVESRNFFIPPPIPWNVLDEIISNPYIQQTLPSTIPLNQAPVPQELDGFRWKLRSSIRTGFFCLVPADSEFSHQLVADKASAVSLGNEVNVQSPISGASITSRFLDWLRKTENLFGLTKRTLNITILPERQKRGRVGLVPNLVTAGANDWFHFHSEPVFQFPRPFIFSIEWILCHSALIEHVIASLDKFAKEDNFQLIKLSHSLLYPVPGGPEGSFDPLPFHPRTSIKLPEWTRQSFFGLLLGRLMDQLGLLLLLTTKDGWTLMSKNGSVFVEIKATSVDWIPSNTLTAETSCTDFSIFKQALHTSLIDSQRHSDS